MASFVSSLSRRLSLSNDGPQTSPRTPGSSMPNSPSFNDFSLGAEMAAENELWDEKSRSAIAQPMNTTSYASPSSRWSSMFSASPPKDVPQSPVPIPNTPAQSMQTAQSVPRRRPEGKIGGMSYYDYHDLIRSSSL